MRDTNKIYILSQGGMDADFLEGLDLIPPDHWSEDGLNGLLEQPDNYFNGQLHGFSDADEQVDNSNAPATYEVDLNTLDRDGCSMLHRAVFAHNVPAARALVIAGATAHHNLGVFGNFNVLVELIHSHFDSDDDGRALLQMVEYWIPVCGDALVYTDSDGKTALYYAVLSLNIPLVQKLLQSGAYVNQRLPGDGNVLTGCLGYYVGDHYQNRTRYTARGLFDMITFLIDEWGAETTMAGHEDRSAMYYAVKALDFPLVRALLDARKGGDARIVINNDNFDVWCRPGVGGTALYHAVINLNIPITRALLESGADVNHKLHIGPEGRNVLTEGLCFFTHSDIATFRRYDNLVIEMVQLLLRWQATTTDITQDGGTLLHMAAGFGDDANNKVMMHSLMAYMERPYGTHKNHKGKLAEFTAFEKRGAVNSVVNDLHHWKNNNDRYIYGDTTPPWLRICHLQYSYHSPPDYEVDSKKNGQFHTGIFEEEP